MKILALDTSTPACSAALYVDGEVYQRYHFAPRLHGELLLPMIDNLLNAQGVRLTEIDALAYGSGPGSFTGVRFAASCAQALAVGANKPIIAISSLQALAQTFYTQLGCTQVACAFDARMHEVYWGIYQMEAGEWALQGVEQVIAPDDLEALPSGNWIGIGDGWHSYGADLTKKTGIKQSFPRCYPQAASIAELSIRAYQEGKCLEPNQALPTYIRNKVTH